MKVAESSVRKLCITQVDGMDAINVFMEDFKPGQGRITIECLGDAWSNFWGAMGDSDIRGFFVSAGEDYLAGKLAPSVSSTLANSSHDDVVSHLKKRIVGGRRDGVFSKSDARDLWDRVEDEVVDGSIDASAGILSDVLGDEWWDDLPSKPNEEHARIIKIIRAVKEALRQAPATPANS